MFKANSTFRQCLDVVAAAAGCRTWQQDRSRGKGSTTSQALYYLPKDGEKVPQTFTVRFGLSGMGVAPAGVQRDNTGHHHLLIDVDDMPDLSKPLPATDKIIHFGGGQTETQVTLPPGKHTLQLVLGNYMHVPHENPIVSKKITVVVE